MMRYSNNVPQCACCGELEYDFLSLDHIIPQAITGKLPNRVGVHLYRKLKREGFPDGYQILCSNCNLAKRDHGVCIHDKNFIDKKLHCIVYESQKKFQDKIKQMIIEKYSNETNACVCCKLTDIRFLALDHIYSIENYKGMPRGGYPLFLWLRKAGFPPGFQILCHNCNHSKAKHGICVHMIKNNEHSQPNIINNKL